MSGCAWEEFRYESNVIRNGFKVLWQTESLNQLEKSGTLKLRLPTSSSVSSESASCRPSSNCVDTIHLPRCSFKNISGSQGPPLSRPRFSHRTLPSPRLPPRLGRPRPRPPARPPPSRPQSSKRCHQGWSSCKPAIWTQRLARKQPG